MPNIIDRIALTPEGVRAYHALLEDLVPLLQELGIEPDDLSDEHAEELPDGALHYWFQLPNNGGKIELTLPSRVWTWRGLN